MTLMHHEQDEPCAEIRLAKERSGHVRVLTTQWIDFTSSSSFSRLIGFTK